MSYKAGIIGAGGIAGMGILGMHDEEKIGREKIRASHAGGYDAAEGVELVSIADVDDEKLRRFGEAWGIPLDRRYVGHEAMLAAEDLDVISVCTPSFLHHRHVIDAVRSQSSPSVVWCEKPLASEVTNANEMIEACEETDTELVVNHSFRFTDKLRRLRELVHEENLLGEVHSVSAQFRMELLRNSTHLLDTLVYLLDARARTIGGYVNGENEAVDSLGADQSVDDAGGGGFVVMDDGTFATIDCTVPRESSSMTLNFIGSEGKLYMNNDDGEWRYWSLEDGEHVERSLPGIEGSWTWEDDYANSFTNAAEHVVDLVDGGTENHSTGVEATRSLEIIVGIYLSHYTGGQVEIPLERPLQDVSVTSW
ncbi:Gfo/Idh/MocA family protein [Halopelagius longus]|uniref:Gfo/Idh/MocA family oxidoreductase n=1 Tax=Halopelagius longus TaxID=1236180 RepID=A0A1H1FBW4_9EURY|nr:Gfo/Idh/MocA family oxidoreductase [Halopelagius longus]RDI70177.1 gfo/Idh/MocA family oxidoreductase [Halopelagius longus]SDQ98400.1 Predicted dehydrogenase [Halopelagius longus]